jgi:histidyl-tRNA synthetase
MSDEPVLAPPRGMRDFYPADMAVRQHLFRAWRDAAERFGFEAYDACVVESLELLKRKGGEEIVDQIYSFVDKSDRALALRAEMTPTLARMIAARENELAFPVKWYAVAQCFRYERMSRGRKREHYQWNLDIVGEESVVAEAEVLGAALEALRLLGLGPDDLRVHVNSRALLSDLFATLGIPREHHAATFLALDKRGKIEDEAITAMLRDAGLSPEHSAAAFRVLGLTSLDEVAALLPEAPASLQRLRDLFRIMERYAAPGSLVFDISVIRGLGYYTGIVFEGFDAARSLRAVFGGGRYDNLLADIGGRPATAVGLGFGDVVIAELLAEKGRLPATLARRDMALGYMDAAQRDTAIQLARAFRAAGARTDLALRPEKPKAFFGRTGKGGFRAAVYLGPDDLQRGAIRVKNLADRTETERSIADVLANAGPALPPA